jgi:mannose-1-phosphate guanylyltransferase/mannose-1-phosphate guanylyltransferase/mannose-6-phosphate isomerase
MNQKEKRPWGWFEILYEEKNLKIKRILVKPGLRLSLQSHKHRVENWTIIKGTAVVTRDTENIRLTANQAVFIPAKAKHRIENVSDTDLVFMEIQSGSYLGEDDIIRYEDDFNRI